MISSSENKKAWLLSIFTSIVITLISHFISQSTDIYATNYLEEHKSVIEIVLPEEKVIEPKVYKRVESVKKTVVKERPVVLPEREERSVKHVEERTFPEEAPLIERQVAEMKDQVMAPKVSPEPSWKKVQEGTLTLKSEQSSAKYASLPPVRPSEPASPQRDPLVEYFQKLKELIKQQKKYPEEAKRRGQEGTVVLKLKISETGKIEKVEIIRSSGVISIDRETLRAIRALGSLPPPPTQRALEFNLEVEYKLGG